MTDHIDELVGAIEALEVAGDALQSAADMLSDRIAEYHGDRGLGVPKHGPKSQVARLYALSADVVKLAEQANELRDGLR